MAVFPVDALTFECGQEREKIDLAAWKEVGRRLASVLRAAADDCEDSDVEVESSAPQGSAGKPWKWASPTLSSTQPAPSTASGSAAPSEVASDSGYCSGSEGEDQSQAAAGAFGGLLALHLAGEERAQCSAGEASARRQLRPRAPCKSPPGEASAAGEEADRPLGEVDLVAEDAALCELCGRLAKVFEDCAEDSDGW